MNNRKIHIIHPKDETTDFLKEITSYVKENTDDVINELRLETKEEHSSFFETIHNYDENDLLLFLGHGTSNALSGANTNEYESKNFISENQLKIFQSKNVLLLSCRSNQYLKSYFKDCGLKNAIGFPNLITEFDELPHHDDPERYKDTTEENIEQFKNSINEIMKFSLEDYVKKDLSLFQLYNLIKLRINKRIINLYNLEPTKGKLPLGKMLNDMVNNLQFYQ